MTQLTYNMKITLQKLFVGLKPESPNIELEYTLDVSPYMGEKRLVDTP